MIKSILKKLAGAGAAEDTKADENSAKSWLDNPPPADVVRKFLERPEKWNLDEIVGWLRAMHPESLGSLKPGTIFKADRDWLVGSLESVATQTREEVDSNRIWDCQNFLQDCVQDLSGLFNEERLGAACFALHVAWQIVHVPGREGRVRNLLTVVADFAHDEADRVANRYPASGTAIASHSHDPDAN